ncbi:hypothetical protein MHYP_G00195360 [Metynnis hypsauchen]
MQNGIQNAIGINTELYERMTTKSVSTRKITSISKSLGMIPNHKVPQACSEWTHYCLNNSGRFPNLWKGRRIQRHRGLMLMGVSEEGELSPGSGGTFILRRRWSDLNGV